MRSACRRTCWYNRMRYRAKGKGIKPRMWDTEGRSFGIRLMTTLSRGAHLLARAIPGGIGLAGLGCFFLAAAGPALYYAVDTSRGGCELTKLTDAPPSEAATNPDKVAWEILTQINQRAEGGNCLDLDLPSDGRTDELLVNQTSRDTCWQRWADAGAQGVYADPDREPEWPTNEREMTERHPSKESREPPHATVSPISLDSAGVPSPSDEIFRPEAGVEVESRMNRATLDYIRCQGLWNKDGQVAALNEINARRRGEIQFPYGAMEVKAGWRKLCDADGRNCQVKEAYYWRLKRSQDGSRQEVWGLVALHVMSKVLPNWLWATWEHKDNPEIYKVRRYRHDAFGYPNGDGPSMSLRELFRKAGFGAGSAWRNYRLIGTQVNTVRSTGEATYLGNSVLEQPVIDSSSCMTCHTRAAVNGKGVYLPINRRSSPGTSARESYNGPPDPLWFLDQSSTTSIRFAWLPLDYVTSLRNAKWKSGARN